MIVYAAGSVELARLIQPIFDKVLWKQEDVALVGAMILGAYFLKGVGSYVSGYLMTDVGQRVVMDLRNQLFRHIVDQSAAFFAKHSSGQLVSYLTNDVGQVQMAVSETAADFIRESLAVVGYVGLLFYLDWKLALVCLCAGPLVVYPMVRLGQRVRKSTQRGQEELQQLNHLSTEAFTGHRIVKAFGAESREASRFGRSSWL